MAEGRVADEVGCSLRILLSNHHLEVRAGSELVTLEVAETLLQRGHQVALFTFRPGRLAVDFEARTGIAVLSDERRDEILAFDADVIHAHHWPTLALLRRFGVDAPVVMGFLGTIPDLENPPPIAPGNPIPWWGVSEEVDANVRAIPGWGTSPSVLIRNWFDDRGGTPPPRQDAAELERILVVSNDFPEDLMRTLRAAAEARGMTVTHVGLPENPQPVDDVLLTSFDAVVSLGRTAICCLALGVPVLVLDEDAADGWVTAEVVARLSAHNFSGRARRIQPTPEQLEAWLDSPPTLADLQQLQGWAAREASLVRAVDRLESLYQEAIEHPAGQLGRWSHVVADYASHELILARENGRLRSALDDSRRALDDSQRELERISAELRAAHGTLGTQQAALSALTAEHQALLASLSWRITSPLRSAKRAVRRVRG